VGPISVSSLAKKNSSDKCRDDYVVRQLMLRADVDLFLLFLLVNNIFAERKQLATYAQILAFALLPSLFI
jgi:hypothetical protein